MMKPTHRILTLVAVLATAVIATEPAPKPSARAEAELKVNREIAARLPTSGITFSRAGPRPPRAQFHQWVEIDGEERLPFEIREVGLRGTTGTMVTGYLRLKDQTIFIFDPRTQKHIRADHDPRFAPPKTKATTDKPG